MDTRVVFLFVLALGIVHCKLVNLTCKEITRFVNGHNERRLQVASGKIPKQPAASKMNSMVWDEELAKLAAAWAKKGKYGHNPKRTLASKRFDVGENIYMYSTSAKNYQFDVDTAINSWFEEYKNYDFTPLEASDFERTGDQQIGHYTQMVWSNTVYIGCALSQLQQGKYTKFYVVCNYGPGGNYLGEVPYVSGRSSGRLLCGAKDCSRPYGTMC